MKYLKKRTQKNGSEISHMEISDPFSAVSDRSRVQSAGTCTAILRGLVFQHL